jgi:hypothetical protein
LLDQKRDMIEWWVMIMLLYFVPRNN